MVLFFGWRSKAREMISTRFSWKVILLPVQEEVLHCWGILEMNPILKGKRVMVSQGFYRKDSDYSKNKCSQNSAIGFSIWSAHTLPVDLSIGLSAVHHWIVLWAYDRCMHIFTCEHVWACVRVGPVLISHSFLVTLFLVCWGRTSQVSPELTKRLV